MYVCIYIYVIYSNSRTSDSGAGDIQAEVEPTLKHFSAV
jgi:hypothetical protein